MDAEQQLQKNYGWKRFWVRAETELILEEDAYLPNPDEEFSHFLNRGVVTLAQVSDAQCSILLGEPGIGKSRTLQTDFNQLNATWAAKGETGALIDIGPATGFADLKALLLEDERVQQWRTGEGILHLWIDSLDEALPSYPGVAKGLMTLIQGLPKERVRWAIACRAGEFPLFLHDSLDTHFAPHDVSILYSAPLTQKDVHLAATANDLDPDVFLNSVRDRGVQPMAARPITLDLLLGETQSGSDLLPEIWTLYERGCRRMLSERRDSGRSTQAQTLDVDQRVAVAGRIACLTTLGAHSAIEVSPDSPERSGAVALAAVSGGQEIASGNSFPVSMQMVHEVLKTVCSARPARDSGGFIRATVSS